MTITEKAQAALNEYAAKKKERKEIAKKIKTLKEDDETLDEAATKKKDAADDYKSELFQFEGRNERVLNELDEAKAAEKEARAEFDWLYEKLRDDAVIASNDPTKEPVQMSLFAPDGRRVIVTLATKIAVEKDVKKPETEEGADDAE